MIWLVFQYHDSSSGDKRLWVGCGSVATGVGAPAAIREERRAAVLLVELEGQQQMKEPVSASVLEAEMWNVSGKQDRDLL